MLKVEKVSSDSDFKTFYNDYSRAISSHLLSPTEIDCAGLDLTSLSSYSNRMLEKSWFLTEQRFHPNKNLPRTYFQSYTSSRLECTDCVSTATKSRKIRIYPTLEQRNLLKQWFGVARKAYNETLLYFKNTDKESRLKSWENIGTFILNSEGMDYEYVKKVPHQIKKLAVKDFCDSLRATIKKKKPFEMKFRSKKSPKQTINIPSSAIKPKGVFYTILGVLRMRGNDNWINDDDKLKFSKLVLDRGRYYLVIPKTTTITNKHIDNQDVVSLDLGIRNFITYFSIKGHFGFLGKDTMVILHRLQRHMDSIRSVISTTKDKLQKHRLKRKLNKLSHRLESLVDELHWKTINYISTNYNVVVCPPFNVSSMMKKHKRNIPKSVARAMSSLRFYVFKTRLKQKCEALGVKFIEQDESYTSMTDSFTGEIISNLQGRKYINTCGYRIHRDVNGSRNILLRGIMRDDSFIG